MPQHVTEFFRPQAVAGATAEAPPSRRERGPTDVVLLVITGMLVSIGMLTIYTATSVNPQMGPTSANDLYYLQRQGVAALLGLGLLVVASRVDYDIYRRLALPLLLLGLLALCLPFVPGLGLTLNGATRWVRIPGIPFLFQPAEVAKLIAVMVMAYSVAKKQEHMARPFEAFVAHTIILGPFIFLLLMQPDLGSSVVIALLAGSIVLVGGARTSWIFGFAMAGAVVLWGLIRSASYRMDRWTSWMDPWSDMQHSGFQLASSYIAFAQGGFTGTGLGMGHGARGYVPELANDFIAASIAEQFGVIGIAVLCLLFVLFLWRGGMIAHRARDPFGTYLAFGITALVGAQATINLGVVTGLFPTKGLTLPFVSYGGSSLLILLFAVGVLLNIGQRNPNLHVERLRREAERDREEARASKFRRVRERKRDTQRKAAFS